MNKKPSPGTLDELARIVGEKHALRDESAMAPYLTEWRDRYRGKAALVLRPGSTEEVSAILKCANDALTAIVPQGGNTGLVGAQIPDESGDQVVLSLERLTQVRDIDLASSTMTVEAGLTLTRAQDVAETAGRFFPLSLASEGSCQIGGVLATNAGGMAVLAYGNARDLTLGLEVVLADGRVWHGLKRLRKDNTGYDLKDLFVGSEGTLGIITAAVLRLFPQPVERVTCVAGLTKLEHAPLFFARAQESAGAMLAAFEILPRIGIEFALRHGSDVRDPFPAPYPWYVLFELTYPHESEEPRQTAERLLEAGIEAGEIADAVIGASRAQARQLWRLRELMSEMQKYEGGSIKHDISVPVAAVPEFIARANQLVELMIPGARPVPFGHLGDGNIHYNVSQPVGMDKAVFLANWEALNAAVHEIALDLDGSISAEHGIGRMKRDLLPHAKGDLAVELMRKIKTSFDPNGILNPGKLLSSEHTSPMNKGRRA
jgi:FAD/FMN-containing dehydrogenase